MKDSDYQDKIDEKQQSCYFENWVASPEDIGKYGHKSWYEFLYWKLIIWHYIDGDLIAFAVFSTQILLIW